MTAARQRIITNALRKPNPNLPACGERFTFENEVGILTLNCWAEVGHSGPHCSKGGICSVEAKSNEPNKEAAS